MTTPEGTVMTASNFTVKPVVAAVSSKPVIKSFSPLRGKVGAKVRITGMNLGGTMWVKFGGVKAATFTVPKRTLVVATVPKKAHSGSISLKTSDGTATVRALHRRRRHLNASRACDLRRRPRGEGTPRSGGKCSRVGETALCSSRRMFALDARAW